MDRNYKDPDLNEARFTGNLTRDPEIHYLPNGTAVCNLGLACNRRYRNNDEDKEETLFLNMVAWGKTAEWASGALKKGSAVMASGRMKSSVWEKDGVKKEKMELVVERLWSMTWPEQDPRCSGPKPKLSGAGVAEQPTEDREQAF